ncbi:hypothetical protein AgCh_020111 [Apium graveolens]
MGPDVEDNKWPPWLKPLLEDKFFDECKLHSGSHKNECNFFCLDCHFDPPLCSLCLPLHKDHPVIQIRRSSYHDVIRVGEIQKYLDLTSIQTYVINSSKVVFLNKRPQLRPGKGVTNTCKVCDRGLLDNFHFCSIGCKIAGTSNFFVKNHFKTLAWDVGESYYSSGGSSNEHGQQRSNIGNGKGFSPSTPLTTTVNFKTSNRRKGIPRRAPTGGLIIEY